MLAGARPPAVADREDVLAGQGLLLLVDAEAGGDQLDPALLLVGHLQQTVLDVGDAHVARVVVADGVGARGPHLGVVVRFEEPVAHLLGQAEVLAALHGHHLLAAHVALAGVLPDDLAALLAPPAVVHGDLRLGAEEVLQQQGERQADRAAARDGDPQHRTLCEVLAAVRHGARHRERHDRLHGVRDLEPELLVADGDGVSRLEQPGFDVLAVHLRSVAAAAVVQHVALGLVEDDLGVEARNAQAGYDDRVIGIASEGDPGADDRYPFSGQQAFVSNEHRRHGTSFQG